MFPYFKVTFQETFWETCGVSSGNRLRRLIVLICFVGHIPAHILGDMWCQQWTPIEQLLLPYPDAGSVDVTDELIAQVCTYAFMNYTLDKTIS